MSNSTTNITLQTQDDPTVNIKVIDGGLVSGTADVNPVINFVTTGEQGPTGEQGAEGSISGNETVTRSMIAEDAIDASKIQNGSLTGSLFDSNSISGSLLQEGTINPSKLQDNSIGSDKIQNNSINADLIEDGSITRSLLSSDLITANEVQDNSLQGAQLENNTITRVKLTDNSVDGDVIENDVTLQGTVTVNHLELSGSSPSLIEGPSDDSVHIKSHDELIIQNTTEDNNLRITQAGNLYVRGLYNDVDIISKINNNSSKLSYSLQDQSKVEHISVSNDVDLDAIKTKVDGVETNADVTDSTNVQASGALMDFEVTNLDQVKSFSSSDYATAAQGLLADSAQQPPSEGAFVDGDKTKLDGIESNATADQTASEIRTLVESASDSNVFTDADHTKLDGVQTGATNDSALTEGNIFLGNALNLSQSVNLSTAIAAAGNITIDGDLKIDDDVIKGSSGNVILSSVSDVVTTPLGLFTNLISGYDNGDFALTAGGNIQFTLDLDNNETAQSFSFRDAGAYGTFTEIANLNQSGDLVIEGDLTVKGNQIKGTSSASVLTFGTGTTTLTGSLETSSTIYTNQLWSNGTDGDINIRSQNDINLIIDGNNNNNRDLKIQRGGSGGDDDIIVIDESGVMTMYGSQLGQPAITLQQNTQTATHGAPVFEFFRSAVNSDNSDIGRFDFNAKDSGGSETVYARILGLTEETSSGNEGGQIRLQVASHDGEMVTGFKIEDGDAEDEVDVTIGNGSSSLTTVSGNLNITTNIELGHATDTTIARSAAGEVTIEGKKVITENKVKQQFNLSFVDDIGTTQHYLSWRDQHENSSGTNSDFQDTNYLTPANGRVVCVYVRVGNRTVNSSMTIRVYSQNAGYMQSQSQQEAEAVTVTNYDDFEVFAFYFDTAEHFQAGDLVLISIQDGADSGGTQTYHVTAVLEFDYTQMGRTTSGELT